MTKDMELANALEYLTERFGSTPILLVFTLLVMVLVMSLFSFFGIREKLLRLAVRIENWQLSLGSRIEVERSKLNQSKLVPCSVCGTKELFYHPTQDASKLICICKKCEPFTYSKKCDLCGVSYLFYHPNGSQHEGLDICDLCLSNREHYNLNWFPTKQDDNGKSFINN